jgi:hypothetical protein
MVLPRHLKLAAREGNGLNMALSITYGSPKTRVPQEPSQEQEDTSDFVTVASSYKIQTETSPRNFQHDASTYATWKEYQQPYHSSLCSQWCPLPQS